VLKYNTGSVFLGHFHRTLQGLSDLILLHITRRLQLQFLNEAVVYIPYLVIVLTPTYSWKPYFQMPEIYIHLSQ